MNNYNLIKSINKLGIYLFDSNSDSNTNTNVNISNIVIYQNNKFIINLNSNPITFLELSKLFSEKIIIELSEFIKIPIILSNSKTIITENWIKPLNTNHVIIFFLSKYISEINNNQIKEEKTNKDKDKKKVKKPRKKTIPIALKRKVWDHWVGEQIGKTKCPCCKLTDITQLNFSCGHINAEANGGSLHVSNLRPICGSCNSSMGTKNMNEFIREYGL